MTDKERIIFLESSLDRVIKILETQSKAMNAMQEQIDLLKKLVDLFKP